MQAGPQSDLNGPFQKGWRVAHRVRRSLECPCRAARAERLAHKPQREVGAPVAADVSEHLIECVAVEHSYNERHGWEADGGAVSLPHGHFAMFTSLFY